MKARMKKMKYAVVVFVIFSISIVGFGCSKDAEPTSVDLTSTDLARAFSNSKATLAEFGSSSCIPCKEMKPILQDLATMYVGRLNVVIIDVYEQQSLSQYYKVLGIPTQVIFDAHGNELARHVGAWSINSIIGQLRVLGVI